MQEPRILHSQPEAICAACGSIFVWSWRGDLGAPGWDRIRQLTVAHAKAFPAGSGGITVVSPQTPIPDDDTRKRIARIRQEASPEGMKGGAVLVEGDALRRSILRGVVTGLALLVRGYYPQAVFGEPREAGEWIRGRVGVTAPPLPDLVAAMARVRDWRG